MKAYRTLVNYGSIELEVVMTDNKDLYVTTQQFNALTSFQSRHNDASRKLKALLPEGSNLRKLRVEGSKQDISAIPINLFEIALARLDRKGNVKAQELRDNLVGLSLTQIAYDAFGVKFESQDRAAYLEARQENKELFHPMYTVWLKADGCENYAKEVQRFKAYAGLPSSAVKDYTEKELRLMSYKEHAYHTLRKFGASHDDALRAL